MRANLLTPDDYFQLMLCLNHCVDELRKMRFVSHTESDRLLKLRDKLEHAYYESSKARKKGK